MTARPKTYPKLRIYKFGLFIEKNVAVVVIFGIGILLSTYFLGIQLPNRDFLFLLSGAVATYTLLYHHFVYFKNPTPTAAFIDAWVYSTFIFLLNHATGGLGSPLFFLYLLPIISVRLNFGSNLPMQVTFYIALLNFLELVLQTNPSLMSVGEFLASFRPADVYAAATYMISILIVGLYIRSVSVELTTEHDQVEEIARLNEELRRVDRGKDEFISIASHEIRTPLTALRGGLAVLMEGSLGKLTSDQKAFLQKLISSANRLAAVAEDSLSITSLERHRFTLEIAPFNITELIEQIITDIGPQASAKKIVLKYDKHQGTLPLALGDAKRIETAIINLIDNAIKFTPSGGQVTVTARSSGSKILVAVADTGVGIPHEEMRNLFRKFYRVENVLNESSQGTGLGLYIVKLIMNLHGETVGVESELGKGSTFTLSLKAVPLAPVV